VQALGVGRKNTKSPTRSTHLEPTHSKIIKQEKFTHPLLYPNNEDILCNRKKSEQEKRKHTEKEKKYHEQTVTTFERRRLGQTLYKRFPVLTYLLHNWCLTLTLKNKSSIIEFA